jgi:tRNA(Ile)-lysidine synthase
MSRDKFNIFLSKLPGFNMGDKILLAVSGGIDSVVMTHLFHQSGISFGIAHCNFQLRGNDSDLDESFVKNIAEKLKVPFHSKRFDTSEFAAQNKLSVQMAARQLRYKWFEELLSRGYRFVATAHHSNDNAETILLNLVRGTGIAGVHGIPAISGKIIRPLLHFSRKEIEKFAADHELKWREDQSNQEDYYTRNKIRNQVIPLLEEINPSVIESINNFGRILSGIEKIICDYIKSWESLHVLKLHKGKVYRIKISDLLSGPSPEVIAYEILKKFGYNAANCNDIVHSVQEGYSGSVFLSAEWELIRDREELVLFKKDFEVRNESYSISTDTNTLNVSTGYFVLQREKNLPGEKIQLPIDSNTIYVDAGKLEYPLILRHWKQGDYFYPHGMKGKKLVSDFFTDLKFSAYDKELVFLLLSGEDIIWITGYRSDDRYKVTGETKEILKITFHPANEK